MSVCNTVWLGRMELALHQIREIEYTSCDGHGDGWRVGKRCRLHPFGGQANVQKLQLFSCDVLRS